MKNYKHTGRKVYNGSIGLNDLPNNFGLKQIGGTTV